MKASFVAVMF